MIDNRPPMDATGGAAVRKPGRTLLLSPGRRILMEEEVITPPRGAPRGVQAVPFPDDFPKDSLRDGGLRHKDIGSPVDMLVDTVSRIQKDMAILREENRLLRTPAASQAVQALRRAALTTTKAPRFDGTVIKGVTLSQTYASTCNQINHDQRIQTYEDKLFTYGTICVLIWMMN